MNYTLRYKLERQVQPCHWFIVVLDNEWVEYIYHWSHELDVETGITRRSSKLVAFFD